MRLAARVALCAAGGAALMLLLLVVHQGAPRGMGVSAAAGQLQHMGAPGQAAEPLQTKHLNEESSTEAVSPDVRPPLSVIDNVIPSDDVLMKMSHKDLELLYHSYVNSPQVTCNSVLRMGLITDGGWEHCDDPRYAPNPQDCLVYSYGINFDFSYDDDMAKYGCEVHSFDPSMNTQSHLRGQRVHFHNTGVAATDKVATHMGEKHDQTWQLHSLTGDRSRLNHTASQRRVDVVKMDVEGYELEALLPALQSGGLADVRQLNFESHVGMSASQDPGKDQYIQFLGLFRAVYEAGFRIYLTHRNYMWSAFASYLFPGKKRVKCHEVHTVNIKTINPDWKERFQQQQKQFLP